MNCVCWKCGKIFDIETMTLISTFYSVEYYCFKCIIKYMEGK